MSPTTYYVETSLNLINYFLLFLVFTILIQDGNEPHSGYGLLSRGDTIYGVRNSLMGSVFGPFSGSLSFLVFGLLASKFYFLFLLSSFTAAAADSARVRAVVSPLLPIQFKRMLLLFPRI